MLYLSPYSTIFPHINWMDNKNRNHIYRKRGSYMVNDILASDWLTEDQKQGQIKRAMWMVMATNHKGMEPGKQYGTNGLHDHRFMEGMPGMGMMPEDVMNHGDTHQSHGNHGSSPM